MREPIEPPEPEIVYQQVVAAAQVLRPYVRLTPVERSPALEELAGMPAGREIFLKLENYQVTGSFKVRGALHKLLRLTPEERRRGVIVASSGNHGAAAAYGCERLGIQGTAFVPEATAANKVRAMRERGMEVHLHGRDCLEAEGLAREEARRQGKVYVSPYNDAEVIAGQGTLGLEILEQVPEVDAVYLAVGGGGLAAGVAACLKAGRPREGAAVQVIGASPAAAPAFHACLEAGRFLEVEEGPTLSDGTAGNLEEGSITLERCRRLLDRLVLVSEEEIAAAVRFLLDRHHTLVEGAAGVAVAACLRQAAAAGHRRAVVVLCGANLALDRLRQVLAA